MSDCYCKKCDIALTNEIVVCEECYEKLQKENSQMKWLLKQLMEVWDCSDYIRKMHPELSDPPTGFILTLTIEIIKEKEKK